MKSPFENLSLGLQELVAVIVPGSAVNAILLHKFGGHLFPKCEGSNDIIAWSKMLEAKAGWPYVLAFFAASYFTGYALFVLSSPLEKFYDRVKRFALGVDIVEERDPLKLCTLLYFLLPGIGDNYIKEGTPKKPTNRIVNFFFPYLWNTHQLIQAIVTHKNNHIGSYHDGFRNQTIDAYQYSYRLIMDKQPEMFSEVERYMVTAKFFRSMTVGWLIGGVIWTWSFMGTWPFLSIHSSFLIFLGLSAISFFTFLNRWRKAHHVAFKNAIISEPIRQEALPNPFIGVWKAEEPQSKSQISQIAIEQVPGTWTKINIKIETPQASAYSNNVIKSAIDMDDKVRFNLASSQGAEQHAELCMDGDKLVMRFTKQKNPKRESFKRIENHQ